MKGQDTMKEIRLRPRGQALVLIVAGIVGLIGLTALAIDGGNAYSDRRHAQNAADTSSLAGALALVRGDDYQAVALARAASNGYVDSDPTAGSSSSTVNVEVYNPPISGVYDGNNEYVQVIITSHVRAFFAPVVGVREMVNKVNAVAHAIPPTVAPIYPGNAVVGLDPSACKAVMYQGSANATLYNADGSSLSGIFVNSDCTTAAFFNNSAAAKLTAGSMCAVGGVTYKAGSLAIPDSSNSGIETGCTQMNYPPTEWVGPEASAELWCSTAGTKSGSWISPGHWTGTFPPAGVDHMNAGVYCVDGNFKLNGGDTLTGHDVTIYMRSGDVSWNGGATVDLSAPPGPSDPDTNPFGGLLLYVPLSNPATVTINGNADSKMVGTILAPSSECSVEGTGDAGLHGQVICYDVKLTGSTGIKIYYDPNDNYQATIPPSLAPVQ